MNEQATFEDVIQRRQYDIIRNLLVTIDAALGDYLEDAAKQNQSTSTALGGIIRDLRNITEHLTGEGQEEGNIYE